jgi:hypothetical protein
MEPPSAGDGSFFKGPIMSGRGPQSFKKRQKEQQRKEKQQEKLARRLERKRLKLNPTPEGGESDTDELSPEDANEATAEGPEAARFSQVEGEAESR